MTTHQLLYYILLLPLYYILMYTSASTQGVGFSVVMNQSEAGFSFQSYPRKN